MSLLIRREWAADKTAVRHVLEHAFPTPAEADLVDALRAGVPDAISLVACIEGEHRLVGQILFTPVALGEVSAEESGTMGLAPMSVVPSVQRQGIGAALVRAGVQACCDDGVRAIVVLGHVAYYPRFGFRAAEDFDLYYGEPGFNASFMVRELEPRALSGRAGEVRYHPAFDEL